MTSFRLMVFFQLHFAGNIRGALLLLVAAVSRAVSSVVNPLFLFTHSIENRFV